MVIELRGVEFVNKGAELMLQAIIQQLKRKYPAAVFVMALTAKTRIENLKQHNIFEKKRNNKAKYLPKFIRRRLGWVIEKEIQVILDGSGFAFGDQWGSAYANRRIGANISKYRQQGIKVILLPQAFGPFGDEELRSVMDKIIANADLIFAREKKSYEYLRQISQSDNILLAPDFTNLINGKIPGNFNALDKQVAIIPNYKMIEMKGESGQHYIDFLVAAIGVIRNKQLKPYFLIHEGKRDIEISQKINSLLAEPLEIVTNADPLMVKGIISTALFIISSRFHGIVSALSQGVPCISTSWSHKYEMLHQEYDYEEGLLQNINDREMLEQKIAYLSNAKTNKIISEKLLLNKAKHTESSEKMWRKVFSVISEN